MSTRKLQRLVAKAIADQGVEVVGAAVHRGHYQYIVKLPSGVERRLIVAGSPAIAEHTVAAVVRDVRRLLETR